MSRVAVYEGLKDKEAATVSLGICSARMIAAAMIWGFAWRGTLTRD